jgi:RecA-family ATPase
MYVTFFRDVEAQQPPVEEDWTLEEIAGLIEEAAANSKAELSLIKLARFGNKRTPRGSFRSDENILAVTGCEGDYDGGKVTVEQAKELVEKAGIHAIIYTTPSHTPDAPRFRVFCPFASKDGLQPPEREQMVRRLNGVLGGILADESFTLSQAYYYGRINGKPPVQAIVIDGMEFIDQADQLDAGAIGKSGTNKTQTGNGKDPEGEALDVPEMIRRFATGESMHPSMLRYIGSLARDLPRERIVQVLEGLWNAARQPRYGGRWPELMRVLNWVMEKERLKNPPQTPQDQLPKTPYINPGNWRDNPPPVLEWAVPNLIPSRQVTLFSGTGASGKSTIALHNCAATVIGATWLNFFPEEGPAIFIDAEDDPRAIYDRLDSCATLYEKSMQDFENLRILSMVGQDALMANFNPKTGKIQTTDFYRMILRDAEEIRPKVIAISNLSNVFGGNENDRGQVTQFVGLMQKVAIVANGAMIVISHPSLTGESSRSGLSGSTQWHNAARARMWLHSADKDENGETVEEPDSDARILEFKKNQYGPIGEKVWLRWNRGLFLPNNVRPSDIDKAARDLRVENVFTAILRRLTLSNRRVSPNKSITYAPSVFANEPEAKEAGIGRKELEAAMVRLFAAGTIKVETVGSASKQRSSIVLSN